MKTEVKKINKIDTKKVVFKAGRYIIGDLCHFFSKKDWENFCFEQFEVEEFKSSYFTYKGKYTFYSHSTFSGDGIFPCFTKDFDVPVDSRSVGIAPFELYENLKYEPNKFGLSVITITKDFIPTYKKGIFDFGDVVILTQPINYEESNDDVCFEYTTMS